jgi:hypothetical protein
MVNGASNKPPLPRSRPYCWPFNYPKYVKDFDPNVRVKIFKATIRANSERFEIEARSNMSIPQSNKIVST